MPIVHCDHDDEKMMKGSRPVAAFTQPARSDGSPDEKRVKLAPGIEYHENQVAPEMD
jgi:hypothetical protein